LAIGAWFGVDEDVILGHALGQLVHVVLIDAIQKPQNRVDRGFVDVFHVHSGDALAGWQAKWRK
jgi:hypothetical protein